MGYALPRVGVAIGLCAIAAMASARKPDSARERELLRRVSGLRAAIQACARDARHARPAITNGIAPSETGRIDPGREKELLDAIRLLERQQRACIRQAGGLAAFTMTGSRASIAGVPLKAGERNPVTIEFSNDSPVRAEHLVNVVQESTEGATVGGNACVVRTEAPGNARPSPQSFSAASTSSSIFSASPKSVRLFSL